MCGCGNQQRNAGRRRVITSPASRATARGLQATQTLRQVQLSAQAKTADAAAKPSGLSKEQRDTERRRRAKIAQIKFGK